MGNRRAIHLLAIGISIAVYSGYPELAIAAVDPVNAAAQQQIRQEERERVLRERHEAVPDARSLQPPAEVLSMDYPEQESPCFRVSSIELTGEASDQFQFALQEVLASKHSAVNRCLGVQGINVAMAHVQNAIIKQGYVTTRVLAAPQDLKSGHLILTLIPGRVRKIRFAADASSRGTKWNALPISEGDLLNLRDIEQGLENLKRPPTVEADIQIEPAEGEGAKPGESDIVIRYRQALPFRVTLSLDDSGFDSTGKYQAGVTLSGDNLLTLNDVFYVNFNHDIGGGDAGEGGSRGHTVHYSLPYGYWLFGATASSYDYHQQVAGINQSYIYSGETRNGEVRASRLIYRNAINKTIVSLAGFIRKSFNYIDDTEIEVQRRRTAGWLLDFNQSWYLGRSLLNYTFAYRRGTGAFDAMRAPEEDAGEGTSRMEILTADIGFNLPFTVNAPWGEQSLSYFANIRAQSNFTPLTPQDRFAIGNRYTVRGFDGELTLSADRGWFIRNELSALIGSTGQALYAGLDYGEVDGQSSDLLPGRHLAGAVVGLRGGHKGFSYDLFLGRPLEKPKGFETAKTAAGFNLNWTF
jgi:hemolysin activation/secretion protein